MTELFSKPGNVFVGWGPVSVACIAVEDKRAGLQSFFEFFLAESNCLAVIIWTYDFEIRAVAHDPPPVRPIGHYARSISLVMVDGSARDSPGRSLPRLR